MLTPEENPETTARAVDLRARMKSDFVQRINNDHRVGSQINPVTGAGDLVEGLLDEAMFYVEHLLLEIEGK